MISASPGSAVVSDWASDYEIFAEASLRAAPDGRPLPDEDVAAICNLLLVAGIDTTASALGAALWHLATHADDRRRLVAEPELISAAVEELLRCYSPVTMGRVVTAPLTFAGVNLAPGERVLMNFPAANHDPAVFPDPDRVVLDRTQNRHVAFGVGIHRCAGSNLARMELTTALTVFLARIPVPARSAGRGHVEGRSGPRAPHGPDSLLTSPGATR